MQIGTPDCADGWVRAASDEPGHDAGLHVAGAGDAERRPSTGEDPSSTVGAHHVFLRATAEDDGPAPVDDAGGGLLQVSELRRVVVAIGQRELGGVDGEHAAALEVVQPRRILTYIDRRGRVEDQCGLEVRHYCAEERQGGVRVEVAAADEYGVGGRGD